MQNDLEATRELCRKPGMLSDNLQENYAVVRNGKEVWVPRMQLTLNERRVIEQEVARLGDLAIAMADALERE